MEPQSKPALHLDGGDMCGQKESFVCPLGMTATGHIVQQSTTNGFDLLPADMPVSAATVLSESESTANSVTSMLDSSCNKPNGLPDHDFINTYVEKISSCLPHAPENAVNSGTSFKAESVCSPEMGPADCEKDSVESPSLRSSVERDLLLQKSSTASHNVSLAEPSRNNFGKSPISIRFSKAAFNDSDTEEGAEIAINLPPPAAKESTANDKRHWWDVDAILSSVERLVSPFDSSNQEAADDRQETVLEKELGTATDGELTAAHRNLRSASSDSCLANKDITETPKVAKGSSDRKRKASPWYTRTKTNLMLSSSYKSRSVDFKRIFKDIPSSERLIVDYSCALQKDILVHGRLYISRNWFCFYSNILLWETAVVFQFKDVVRLTKKKKVPTATLR